MHTFPWLFGLATALWFGFLARRSGRSTIAWAIAGAMFGLITSTIVLGVNHAVFIPMSQRDYLMFRVREFIFTALLLGILGWLMTASLHHQPAKIWRALAGKSSPNEG